jgi:hypothetical protein
MKHQIHFQIRLTVLCALLIGSLEALSDSGDILDGHSCQDIFSSDKDAAGYLDTCMGGGSSCDAGHSCDVLGVADGSYCRTCAYSPAMCSCGSTGTVAGEVSGAPTTPGGSNLGTPQGCNVGSPDPCYCAFSEGLSSVMIDTCTTD